MQKLTITIETDANINKEDLTALGANAADLALEILKLHWRGTTIQSSKVEVTDVK